MIIHSLSTATVAKQEGEVNVSARDCQRKPYSFNFFSHSINRTFRLETSKMSNFRFEQDILVMKYLTPHLALFQWHPSDWFNMQTNHTGESQI